MEEVRIENISSISIMGLIIKSIVDKNIADPSVAKKIARKKSVINIQAGQMKIHLIMNRGDLEIKQGFHDKASASVRGTMTAIMSVGKGEYHKIPLEFLRMNFKVGGNVFALMPLLSIMKM